MTHPYLNLLAVIFILINNITAQQISSSNLKLFTSYIHPCSIYPIHTSSSTFDSQYYINKILYRLNNQSTCPKIHQFQNDKHYPIHIIQDSHIKQQGFTIKITSSNITIHFNDYHGYVYALQKITQIYSYGKFQIKTINEAPSFPHRGIMIDSSRHFVKITTLKKLVQSLPLAKINILHWHFIDDQSFPVGLGSHPQLSQSGSFKPSSVYSVQQMKDLVNLAELNGVKIVAQINTPSHSRSWRLNQKYKAKQLTIKCNCTGTSPCYRQQFDVSKAQAISLVQGVTRQIDQIFRTGPFIHLGGDGVSNSCWQNRTSIKSYMKLHNLKSYDELLSFWKFKIRQNLPNGRKVAFWVDQHTHIAVGQNDIAHYRGLRANLSQALQKHQGKVIISPVDLLDLSTGLGNIWLNQTAPYKYRPWKKIYTRLGELIQSVNHSKIIGAELLLWGQQSNDDTLENNVWLRAIAFGQRLWSTQTMQKHQLVELIVSKQKALESLGVMYSPITSQFCQKNAVKCFPPAQSGKFDIQIQ